MFDQGGTKLTSFYIVEVLCESGVHGVLGFCYVVLVAEGVCDDLNHISGEDRYGA